jgi:hypothetical protein
VRSVIFSSRGGGCRIDASNLFEEMPPNLLEESKSV